MTKTREGFMLFNKTLGKKPIGNKKFYVEGKINLILNLRLWKRIFKKLNTLDLKLQSRFTKIW